MHRAQILLDPWQFETLRSMAERTGKSISELVREILNDRLRPLAKNKGSDLDAIEGIANDAGASGRNHDALLYAGVKPRRTKKKL
ncbi:MAG: ribbon-helix-helix protein, CopG family [Planctomycetota bacterium]